MARTIDHIERLSDSFENLPDSITQADMVYELFTRLQETAKAEALRRISNHARMAGMMKTEKRRNGKREEEAAETLQGMEPLP